MSEDTNSNTDLDLKIVRLGEKGYRVLRTKCVDIDAVDDEVKLLAVGMIQAMYKSKGVGLAAPQVGIAVNMVVIDPWYVQGQDPNPVVMINPKVVEKDGGLLSEEACLSCFAVKVTVPRYEDVSVEYTNIEFKKETISLEGFEATVIQHELDHLRGTLIVDYLSKLRRDMYFGKIRKAHRKARKILRQAKKHEHNLRVSKRRVARALSRKIRPECSKSPGGAGALSFRDGAGASVPDSGGDSDS